MTLYSVEGVSTLGNETIIFVQTLAVPSAPTVAELTSASALNLGYASRGFSPTADQATSQDIRLATVASYENPGRVTQSIDDITYVYDPQAAAGTASNKHYETMKQGVKGYIVDRRGIPATTAVAAAQKVDVYPVQLGLQRRVAVDPTADGGKFEYVQKPFITGNVLQDVPVAA